MARKVFGRIEKLPSGRYRARHPDPTPGSAERIPAPSTFSTKGAAQTWLNTQQDAIAGGTWVHPDDAAVVQQATQAEKARKAVAFGVYAEKWVATRTNSKGEPLRPRTRKEYERMLGTTGSLFHWAAIPINEIRAEAVREWRSELLATGKATATARAYDLMKSILKTAVEDGLISTNPCKIKGGSLTTTGKSTTPPTEVELDIVIEKIVPKYKPFVIIAAAGGLRFGEVIGLTSGDVAVERDDDDEVDAVRIAVVRSIVEGNGIAKVAGPPKSAAGRRIIAIFGHDARIVAAHVESVKPGALLWTDRSGGYVSQSTVNNHWRKARAAAGRSDLAFHSLRHYAGTRYAQTGATVAETMARLGHSSVKAAMRYQHAGTRDDVLARRASRR
ncbi:site-specific integrase [Rhodococcus globerulus]|uniref:tyrosine-type recombinase/integrase n=1 Tax=Rhodococcus globerulus TaxID=33008 RepID=UPI003017DF48